MKTKVLPLLIAVTLLSSCSNNEAEVTEATEPEVTTTVTTVDPRLEEVEILSTSSTAANMYMTFLKFGGMDASELCDGDLVDFTFSSTETKESWEKTVDDSNMTSYWRDASSLTSCYTSTFSIEAVDITRWIGAELLDLDRIFATDHQREAMEGATYYYHWTTSSEDCKLQVYSTGETGKYIGLVSFTRVGPTTYDQAMDEVVLDSTPETGEEEVHSHD